MTEKSTQPAYTERAVRDILLIIAFGATMAVLVHLGEYNQGWWNTIVIFTFAWVIADIIDIVCEQRITGDIERRIRTKAVTLPAWLGKTTILKNYDFVLRIPRIAIAFVIYFVVIVAATIAGKLVTDYTLSFLKFVFGTGQASEDYLYLVSNLAGVLVIWDLYYRNSKKNDKRNDAG